MTNCSIFNITVTKTGYTQLPVFNFTYITNQINYYNTLIYV